MIVSVATPKAQVLSIGGTRGCNRVDSAPDCLGGSDAQFNAVRDSVKRAGVLKVGSLIASEIGSQPTALPLSYAGSPN